PHPSQAPIFKFSRETNAVRVENIPENVNRLEVLSLFSTLIGDIRASQDSDDALEITFFTLIDLFQYRKALCMNGYNVAGSALLVTSVLRAASPGPSQGRRTDNRRNLYVLGVPFGMTNQSLAALFAPHGSVTHCVILATLDGASRRRGFVVLSTHEEARQAMAALGRSGKGAGGMDISWAVVQRSKGFLDGGDRAGVVHPPTAVLGCPSPALSNSLLPEQSALPSLSAAPTCTLLIANLPSLLFGSEEDMRGLVCPFGSVKSLRIISLSASPPASSTPAPAAPTTAAIVQYVALPAAQDARRALDGESYAGCTVRVAYLVEADAEPKSAPESPLPLTPNFPDPLILNPALAAPFSNAARCGLAPHKPTFDGRNVGNQLQLLQEYGPLGVGHGLYSAGYSYNGRQWQDPVRAQSQQQQFVVDSYPGYRVSERCVLFLLFLSSSFY
ncbi:hypothetical protein C8J57DRAFT_1066263, partial [Mycena rebaudengoi]